MSFSLSLSLSFCELPNDDDPINTHIKYIFETSLSFFLQITRKSFFKNKLKISQNLILKPKCVCQCRSLT